MKTSIYFLTALLILVGIFFSLAALGLFSSMGKQCGGIAANLPENQCSYPFRCHLLYRMPDSPGVCRLW